MYSLIDEASKYCVSHDYEFQFEWPSQQNLPGHLIYIPIVSVSKKKKNAALNTNGRAEELSRYCFNSGKIHGSATFKVPESQAMMTYLEGIGACTYAGGQASEASP